MGGSDDFRCADDSRMRLLVPCVAHGPRLYLGMRHAAQIVTRLGCLLFGFKACEASVSRAGVAPDYSIAAHRYPIS